MFLNLGDVDFNSQNCPTIQAVDVLCLVTSEWWLSFPQGCLASGIQEKKHKRFSFFKVLNADFLLSEHNISDNKVLQWLISSQQYLDTNPLQM